MLKNDVLLQRTQKRWSQTELADKVGVTRQTIGFIEKGDYAPSVELALQLALALDISIEQLFWLEEK